MHAAFLTDKCYLKASERDKLFEYPVNNKLLFVMLDQVNNIIHRSLPFSVLLLFLSTSSGEDIGA